MFRRVWLLVAIVASVVLGPRVFTSADAPAAEGEVVVAAVAPGMPLPALLAPPEREGSTVTVVLNPPATSPTTAPPDPVEEAPTVPPTTESTEAPPPTTTAPLPPSTTTTEAPPPPPPTSAPPAPAPAAPAPAALSAEHADGTQEGDVSWYDLPGSRSGVCAHRTIEKGTVVTVTNLATGASVTCTVDDRGPYSGDDKVLDLHRDEFSQLAPLEQGVFTARLDW